MESSYPIEVIEAQVRRVFAIEDITIGTSQQPFIVRFGGRLVLDSMLAYDQLSNQLKPLGCMPLFRVENERQVILIIPGVPEPKPSNPWINGVLFFLTLISVLVAGGYDPTQALPPNPFQAALVIVSRGWPFAVSLLAILAAHEFGHYLMGRYHGVKVTLPYFIPFPLSAFGTMGAFINMKSLPKNRRDLFDIAIAGPLAGLIVAVPVLFIGLKLSTLTSLPNTGGWTLEGNSLLYMAAKFLAFGQMLPAPADYTFTPLIQWIVFYFTGSPAPLGGMDVLLHPMAWAGWAGLLVTTMNLIPSGQLDGGHIFSVTLSRRAAQIARIIILFVLFGLGFVWSGWWLWGALIFFIGGVQAEPLDQITPLGSTRKKLALLAIFIFLLTFTPVPLIGY